MPILTPTAPIVIYTIGYQEQSWDTLINKLAKRGVATVVDVRSDPNSKRKHFSKHELSTMIPAKTNCAGRYMKYISEPRLGGFGEPDPAAAEAIMARCAGEIICLLCYEADPHECHRSAKLGPIFQALGMRLDHITPGKRRRRDPSTPLFK